IIFQFLFLLIAKTKLINFLPHFPKVQKLLCLWKILFGAIISGCLQIALALTGWLVIMKRKTKILNLTDNVSVRLCIQSKRMLMLKQNLGTKNKRLSQKAAAYF